MSRIVVVGGGIVGTSVAYHLRTADRPVTLLERDQLGAGATAKSISMFTHHQGTPTETDYRLRARAWEFYEPRIDDGTFSFEEVGTLHTAESEAEMATVETIVDGLAEFGVPVESLDPDALAAYGLVPDSFRGAAHLPADGYLDPSEIVQHFAEAARDEGVDVETDVAVTDVLTEDGAVAGVETTEGTVDATTVVNAAGPWAPTVNEMAGVEAPLRHTEGPILVLRAAEPFSLPLTFFEDGVYVREEGIDQAFAGKFMTDYEDATRLDPEHARSVDREFHLRVAEVLDTYLPALADAEVVTEWNGLRTVTPDGLPIVDETDVDGFVLAAGMSGYGITTAPAVGDLVAEEVRGEASDLGSTLSLDRF